MLLLWLSHRAVSYLPQYLRIFSPGGLLLVFIGSNRAVEPAFSSVIVYRVAEDASAPKGTVLEQVGFSIDSMSWPRGMSLSPSGQHLIVANQKGRYGSTIAVFDRDERTGLLTLSTAQPPFPCPSPACVDWVKPPKSAAAVATAPDGKHGREGYLLF